MFRKAIALLEPPSAALTQLWFTRRLYQFDKKRLWLVFMTAAISFISTVAGLGSAAFLFTKKKFVQFGGGHHWHVAVWMASGLVCDILITVPIAWSLYKTRTGFRTTDRLTARLAVWIINTGALTAALALSVLILFLIRPETLIYVSLHLILASIYSNSLLAFLNRRGRWRRDLRTEVYYMSDIRPSYVGPLRPEQCSAQREFGTGDLSSGTANVGIGLRAGEAREKAEDEFWGRHQ